MNQDRSPTQTSRRREPNRSVNPPRDSGIGIGKKVGLCGVGLLVIGLILVLAVIFLTGYYVPFEGTEGVGP